VIQDEETVRRELKRIFEHGAIAESLRAFCDDKAKEWERRLVQDSQGRPFDRDEAIRNGTKASLWSEFYKELARFCGYGPNG
jgi:hypothetical protein